LGLGEHVAIILVLLVVATLFGFSLSGNPDYDLSKIDLKLFLIPIVLLSLYVLVKSEIPKLKLEINSKILAVFLCVVLLSSVFTGFTNFATPNEIFAEESINSTSVDITDVTSINQTSSVDSNLDPTGNFTEYSTSLNSTSVDITDVTSINQTSSVDSNLDPTGNFTEYSTSLNSTSVDITEVIDTNSTSTEVIDTNSTSTEVIDTNSTSTEVIDTNSTSTEVIDTNSTSTSSAEDMQVYSNFEKTIYHEDIEVDKNVVWHLNISFTSMQNGLAVSLPVDAQIKNISINDTQTILFDSSQIDSQLLSIQDDILQNNTEGISIYSPLVGESELLEIDGMLFAVTSEDLYSLILLDDIPDLIQEGHEFNHLIISNSSSEYPASSRGMVPSGSVPSNDEITTPGSLPSLTVVNAIIFENASRFSFPVLAKHCS